MGIGERAGHLRQILRSVPKHLVIICETGDDLDRQRMLRNMRMFITAAGRAYAAKIEQRYANVVTKDAYLAEIEKRNAEFKTDASRASASMRYQQRLRCELTEE